MPRKTKKPELCKGKHCGKLQTGPRGGLRIFKKGKWKYVAKSLAKGTLVMGAAGLLYKGGKDIHKKLDSNQKKVMQRLDNLQSNHQTLMDRMYSNEIELNRLIGMQKLHHRQRNVSTGHLDKKIDKLICEQKKLKELVEDVDDAITTNHEKITEVIKENSADWDHDSEPSVPLSEFEADWSD